jgi:hypothetical protein
MGIPWREREFLTGVIRSEVFMEEAREGSHK